MPEIKKLNISDIKQKKLKKEKITMLTAYDYPTALLVDQAEIDMILVGDSAANVVLGYCNTIPVTVDELIVLTKAVRKGVQRAILVGDMPFGSYNVSTRQAIKNANRFIKEAGVDCVKIEGGSSVVETVKSLVQAGISVIGHIGLTPQTAGMLGGYKVQAKTAPEASILIDDALRLQDAGIFCLVVECIPSIVGKTLSQILEIPVIGIGAGAECDGQVLVLHDMLGINTGFKPKFVKQFACLSEIILESIKNYKKEVENKIFPAPEHSFEMPADQKEQFIKTIEMKIRTNSK